jgi:hypothetical protein
MTEGLVLDVSVSGLEETAASVDAYPQFVSQELNMAMESALQLLESQVAARTPKNTGQLRQSITHQILSPFPNLVGQVMSPDVPKAFVMEEGRRPGAKFPPVDAIKLWVVRKLGIPPEEADGVAFVIARSIARKGIEGRHMFQEGLEVSEPHINQLFNEAIARSVQRFNAS